jgi:hypothetical protein
MKAIPYFERLVEALSPLKPRPMKTYRGKDITELGRIEVEMMSRDMRCFEADKLDKIVSIKADIMGGKLIVWATNIVPTDEYPLPIFTSELAQAASHVSLRADLHPLADCARDKDYFEKYMMPMEDIWKKYRDLEGAGIERYPWVRVMTSPFYAYGKFKYDETIEDTTLDATVDYLKLYVKLWSETEKGDPAYMTSLNERKRAILQTYRERDPGQGPSRKALGEEKSRQAMELLF